MLDYTSLEMLSSALHAERQAQAAKDRFSRVNHCPTAFTESARRILRGAIALASLKPTAGRSVAAEVRQ